MLWSPEYFWALVILKFQKTKQTKRVRKDKKQRVENADEVAAYESDDGDDEGREFDYMSDSGSDSELAFFHF